MIAHRHLVALVIALGWAAPAAPAADAPGLKAAEAEADRLDPGWRLAEIRAKRAQVPPAQKGATRVIEVARALPAEWREIGMTGKPAGTPAAVSEALTRLIHDDPTKPVPPDLVAGLKAVQAKAGPPLAGARALEKVATGRYEVPIDPKSPVPNTSQVDHARLVARVLYFDALARASAGDVDGGLASARAILGAARSIGDEPLVFPQLVRMALDNMAEDAIERVLARGRATDAALAATQAALAAEAAQPLLLDALRGERALNHDLMGKLAAGEVKIDEAIGQPGFRLPPGEVGSPEVLREDRAISLHRLTLGVEIARRPLQDQPDAWARWSAEIRAVPAPERDRHAFAYLILPAFESAAQAHVRTRAILRAAETAVGLERVRLAKGRWPRPGDPLAPAFNPGAPADPLTGKPMLWNATQSGLVVDSVSYDRADDGGKLDNVRVTTRGTDIGFRLWDADRRPRPAPNR